MAQQQTGVGTKTSTPPDNTLDHIEFNALNDTVNANSTDAETRLSDIETGNTSQDGRLTTIEGTSIPIQSYTSENLPSSPSNGTLAFDTTENTLVYAKNNTWYKLSDNSEIIIIEGFTFVVKTDNTGTSNNDQFTLPLRAGNTYNFTVNWGDGSPDETVTSDALLTHTFLGGAGNYTVSITGVIGGFHFNDAGDEEKLIEIVDFGTLAYGSDGTDAFYGCSNLEITASNAPDTSSTTDFLWFFYQCTSLTTIPLLDLSNGDRYFAMLRNCSSIVTLPNLDFSSGVNSTKHREQFRNMQSLTTLDNCTFGDSRADVRIAFRDCSSLLGIPPTLDFTNATNINSMCFGCSSLATFPTINSSNLTNAGSAWRTCSSLTVFPLIDLSNVGDFSNSWDGCTSLVDFPAINMNSGNNFDAAWKNCALNSASIDNIMQALVANGSSNRITNISGGTTIPFSSWSTQAQADHATLISRGWTVATN